jgi:hypothetical protein
MKKKRLHLFLGDDLFEKISITAEKHSVSISQMAVKILENCDWDSILKTSTPTFYEQLKNHIENYIQTVDVGTEFTLTKFFNELSIPRGYRSRTGVSFYKAVDNGDFKNIKSAERFKNGSSAYVKI